MCTNFHLEFLIVNCREQLGGKTASWVLFVQTVSLHK